MGNRNRDGLLKALDRLKDKHVIALHRVAKKPGALPFFKHPKMMVILRNEAGHRERLQQEGR